MAHMPEQMKTEYKRLKEQLALRESKTRQPLTTVNQEKGRCTRTDCQTIPILSGLARFCSKIRNPDQHAIRKGKIPILTSILIFCTIDMIVTLQGHKIEYTSLWYPDEKKISRNNIKASIVLAMRQPGFVVVSAVTWHLWLDSRSYFLVWSTQSTVQSHWTSKVTIKFPNIFDRNCRPRRLEMVFLSIPILNFSGGACSQTPLEDCAFGAQKLLLIFNTSKVGQFARITKK